MIEIVWKSHWTKHLLERLIENQLSNAQIEIRFGIVRICAKVPFNWIKQKSIVNSWMKNGFKIPSGRDFVFLLFKCATAKWFWLFDFQNDYQKNKIEQNYCEFHFHLLSTFGRLNFSREFPFKLFRKLLLFSFVVKRSLWFMYFCRMRHGKIDDKNHKKERNSHSRGLFAWNHRWPCTVAFFSSSFYPKKKPDTNTHEKEWSNKRRWSKEWRQKNKTRGMHSPYVWIHAIYMRLFDSMMFLSLSW